MTHVMSFSYGLAGCLGCTYTQIIRFPINSKENFTYHVQFSNRLQEIIVLTQLRMVRNIFYYVFQVFFNRTLY